MRIKHSLFISTCILIGALSAHIHADGSLKALPNGSGGGSGGGVITNSAPVDRMMKSDGTNAITSGFYENPAVAGTLMFDGATPQICMGTHTDPSTLNYEDCFYYFSSSGFYLTSYHPYFGNPIFDDPTGSTTSTQSFLKVIAPLNDQPYVSLESGVDLTGIKVNGTFYSAPVQTGSGLSDIGVEQSSTFIGADTTAVTYTIKISATGTPDTFQCKKGSGSYDAGTAITGTVQAACTEGLNIVFLATTGHTLNDTWAIELTPPSISIERTGGNSAILIAADSSATFAGNIFVNAVHGYYELSLTADPTPFSGFVAIPGNNVNINASSATVAAGVPNAAAGGAVNISTGYAARDSTGNADGGDIKLNFGEGIGTGIPGRMIFNTTSTFAQLGTPANGSMLFCSDCTVTAAFTNTTCAGSGSGAFAFRQNGAWKCME